jgi:hypothetical protein
MVLALLQSVLQDMMRPDLIWILVPLAMVGLVAFALMLDAVKEGARKRERDAARKMYERLMLEKLDVIKTAVAMDYHGDELAALDRQLEQLIGQEQMQQLLDKKTPGVALPSQDLSEASAGAISRKLREHE